MKILVDMDEVLCRWSQRMIDLWNAENLDNLVTWDAVKIWSTDTFLGPGSKFFVRSHMRDSKFWESLAPVEGAIHGMRTLVAAGHDVRIVTQVLPEAAGESYAGKLEWIRKYLPFFDLGHVIVTKDKASVKGDILFDDAPHQLLSFQAAGGRAVALSYKWNGEVPCEHVSSWYTFLVLVQQSA